MSESFTCPICGREFGSNRGLGVHKANGHNEPWHDEETLRQLYIEEGLSSYEIADDLGCTPPLIREWLGHFGIERRSVSESLRGKRSRTANFKHPIRDAERYPCWIASNGKFDQDKVYVHRLLAVAEYGFEEVVSKEIHHRNGVQWDNRPENLEVLTPADHRRLHHGGESA
ncbi:HNH endonuclease signature motif containing protein [Natrinema sp. DC36]|uniref:HNH endonuclease signature motif containing protein n=1 Tax=Natrinema sp. DC36 TaxID=2878680 RepID=UPI001CEFCFD2|nr:HNH endonuclease signature motif containing protein [Natrinema sp. DC36]